MRGRAGARTSVRLRQSGSAFHCGEDIPHVCYCVCVGFTGGYLYNSDLHWCDPAGFATIFNASISAYDAGVIEGMYWFSGVWLSAGEMNATLWRQFHLPALLN
eukprot:SAG11_NODE_19515_length_465_cov_0.836066_1_plen_102_part_01